MKQQHPIHVPTVEEKIGIPVAEEVTPEPVSMVKPTSPPPDNEPQEETNKTNAAEK